MSTHYTILNVDPRASVAVIEAAYKVLAIKHHPDHNGGKDEVFVKLGKAKDVLTNDIKRRDYDKSLFGDPDKKVIGSYEIVKFIAEGAMGRTYLVRHVLNKKLACLKACLGVGPEYEEVMLNESAAIWDIRHYAFPAVREIMKLDDGALAIVMSYIPGPTLEQCVKHLGKIDVDHVLWISERLLAGLNYLHANGVIHGDIKPQNVIIQPEHHGAVLIDFGLSMIKPTAKDKNIGFTDFFSPPEQLLADRKPLVPETDLYSFGMTMLYLLNGKVVKLGETWPTMHSSLKEFLKKLTQQDINNRPNWTNSKILEDIQRIRVEVTGSRNSRGKVFPNVPLK